MIKELYNRLGRIERLLEDTHFKEVIYLNSDEAAEFLKIKKSYIYQLRFQRKIPYHKRGKILLFNKAELVRWVEEKKMDTLENLASRVNVNNVEDIIRGQTMRK